MGKLLNETVTKIGKNDASRHAFCNRTILFGCGGEAGDGLRGRVKCVLAAIHAYVGENYSTSFNIY